MPAWHNTQPRRSSQSMPLCWPACLWFSNRISVKHSSLKNCLYGCSALDPVSNFHGCNEDLKVHLCDVILVTKASEEWLSRKHNLGRANNKQTISSLYCQGCLPGIDCADHQPCAQLVASCDVDSHTAVLCTQSHS